MAHHNNTPPAVLAAPALAVSHVTTVAKGSARRERRHYQLTKNGPVLFRPTRYQAPATNAAYVRATPKRRGKKAARHRARRAH